MLHMGRCRRVFRYTEAGEIFEYESPRQASEDLEVAYHKITGACRRNSIIPGFFDSSVFSYLSNYRVPDPWPMQEDRTTESADKGNMVQVECLGHCGKTFWTRMDVNGLPLYRTCGFCRAENRNVCSAFV
jgi:hypothetical protein